MASSSVAIRPGRGAVALTLSVVLAAGLLAAAAAPVAAAVGDITTIAGSAGEGPATGVSQEPNGLALRGSSLFVSDARGHMIRVIDLTTGVERVVAGTGAPGARGDGGPAMAAGFDNPEGIDLDAAGNLYVADTYNGEIRRIDTSGTVTTVAGKIEYGHFAGDGGPATQANLNSPTDVAVDAAGNLFIADYFNHRVRKVDPSGIITTIAGNGTEGYGGDGGPATQAQLQRPAGVAVDGAGDVFVADSFNNRVRKVDPAGIISTVAGTGATGLTGDGGPATAAAVYQPGRVDLDAAGNLYVAQDQASAVRRVDTAGTITTFAGQFQGMPPGGAPMGSPQSMVFDAAGNMYVAATGFSDNRVHKVTPSGAVSAVAGNGFASFSGDGGPATAAQIGEVPRLALGPGGDLFVAEIDNDRIRRVDGSGTISTVVTADYNVGGAIAFDRVGNLYSAEPSVIRRIDSRGGATIVAGTGTTGFTGDGGPATAARINYPSGMALDAVGNIYFADSGNDRVRRVDTNGVITTVAGGGPGPLGDGAAATAASLDLFYQSGVAVDSRGNLFVADGYHLRVRKVGTDGVITTVAGTGTYGALGDGGSATGAYVGFPGGLAVDGSDNLYVVDAHNARVRRVDGRGVITTVAGNGTTGYRGDGGPATSAEVELNAGNPSGATLVVDASGNLLVGEPHHIRRVTGVASPVPALPVTSSTTTSTPTSSTTSTSTSTTSTSTTSTSTTTSSTPTTVAPPRTRAWGLNQVGELGDGTTTTSSAPGAPGTVVGSAEVAAGFYHSVTRRDDGTVWSSGWNALGQLGDGTTVERHTPVQAAGISNVRAVAAGAAHTLALRDDGTVWAWGWGAVGQLGTGTTVDQHLPVQVPGLSHVVAVAAGAFHSLAVRDDGTVWAWGWNADGELGDATTTFRPAPVQVPGLTGARTVAAGTYHSLALLGDGTVRSWGWNAYGQLGNGTTVDAHRPVTVAGLTAVTSVAAGATHSLAARNDGTVRAWGWNGVGQLGDGTTIERHTPVVSGPLAGVRLVAAGGYHSLAVGTGGAVLAWGWNAYGQLGDGTTTDRNRPVATLVPGGAFTVSGGLAHTLAGAR
jgi:alpha-tubulin suppressor-like RCC1 family protein/sugar lactone lactonase YvrE